MLRDKTVQDGDQGKRGREGERENQKIFVFAGAVLPHAQLSGKGFLDCISE